MEGGSRPRRADPAGLTALGILGNADERAFLGGKTDLDGEPVDETSVLVTYTWHGDPNLDSKRPGSA